MRAEKQAGVARHNAKYPGYWTVKRMRRAARNALSRWLAHDDAPPVLKPLEPRALRRILVCRRNRRLGNMLLLTPLLRSLAATVPHAQIDVLIGDARYASLFDGLDGLRKVWVMPARGFGWPGRLITLLLSLRWQSYDLVIEPSPNSFSNRLLARLCGGRARLGFHTPDQWLSLTHAVVRDSAERHEALVPLQLVRDGFGSAAVLRPQLGIALGAEEREAGRARLLDIAGRSRGAPLVGYFTAATGKKNLPESWWGEWRATAQRAAPIRLVKIVPPGEAAPDIAHIMEPDYRRLAATLAALDLFVSGDSGPMHLAAAAGCPTIGVFRATSPERYRPLSPSSAGLRAGDSSAAEVAQRALEHLGRAADRRVPQVGAARQRLGQRAQSRPAADPPASGALPLR